MKKVCVKHGHNRRGKKTPEYQTWADMLQRCNNPNDTGYKDYGGRGIRVCKRWHNFENFLEDVGIKPPGLTLDRLNNDGHYEPNNWWWATRKEQVKNRRDQKNQYWFYGFGPHGEIIVKNNQCEVAKAFKLEQTNICACLNGRLKTTGGWRFERIYHE